jgi:hypothetical protein
MTVAVKVRRAPPKSKPAPKPQPQPQEESRELVAQPVGQIVRIHKPLYREGELRSNKLPVGTVVAITKHDGYYFHYQDHQGVERHLRSGSQFVVATPAEQEKFVSGVGRWNMCPGKCCTTGFDPEVFVLDGEGQVLPAFRFLPGKKELQKGLYNAQTTDKFGSQCGYQLQMFWDGFQAEFASAHGFSCHQGAVDAIQQGLSHILAAAKKLDPQARLTHQCVVETPLELLEQCAIEHTDLACQPSQNAYGESEHLIGLEPRQLPFRFAGFHIHLNLPNRQEEQYRQLVRMLDAVVGVASVSLLAGLEDPRRRRYYGLAGEYRLPKHGLEYRVLSSAALAHPLLAMLLLDFTRQAAHYQGMLAAAWRADSAEVQSVINNLDVAGARAILGRNEAFFGRLMNGLYSYHCNPAQVERATNIWQQGAGEFLDLSDLHANWHLEGTWKFLASGPNCSVVKLVA